MNIFVLMGRCRIFFFFFLGEGDWIEEFNIEEGGAEVMEGFVFTRYVFCTSCCI